MSDEYGFLAPIYQPLSQAVFGKDLVKANSAFTMLGQGRRSLIIGGGDAISYRDWDESFSGEYWDTSSKMAELARINLRKTRIQVHGGPWPGKGKFDCIFLPFVLDTMPDQEISRLLVQISNALTSEGRVILSEFFLPQTFAQKIIQKLMISSFRIFAGHPRKDLPDLESLFHPDRWTIIEEKVWRRGWIRARVYKMRDSAH
jgi:hypothetical protein